MNTALHQIYPILLIVTTKTGLPVRQFGAEWLFSNGSGYWRGSNNGT